MSCDDSELVKLAKRGDKQAFAKLCLDHQQRIWRITTSIATRSEAEDLAQETVIRAWCSIRSCRDESSFEAWICSIALNAAHDYYRSWWRRKTTSIEDEAEKSGSADETYADAERRESARRVRRAIAALPHAQRQAVWLYYIEQFTLEEIAILEKRSESAIRNRIQSGLCRLKVSLIDLEAQIEAGENCQVKGVHP